MNNLPNHNLNALQSMLNVGSMKNISQNLDEILSKYVLECLIYTLGTTSSGFSTSFSGQGIPSPSLGLTQLALQRRANLVVPKARYPDVCCSPKSDENRDRLESMSTSREEGSPIVTDPLEASPLAC